MNHMCIFVLKLQYVALIQIDWIKCSIRCKMMQTHDMSSRVEEWKGGADIKSSVFDTQGLISD